MRRYDVRRFDYSVLIKKLKLKGAAVCTFYPAAPGSNPKHTINAFINLNLNCDMLKKIKIKREKNNNNKESWNAIIHLKIWYSQV